MAHRDEQVRLEFSVAIGGAADMDGRAAQPEIGANDPRSLADIFCCAAQRRDAFCRNANASRLSRPMMWNKLVFADRNLWNMTAAIIRA
jgi:hypothetical protein